MIMKTIVLLLACLAAANAAYVVPQCGYSSYSIAQYYRMPQTCFHFRVYFDQSWYTSRYYSTILKVYPNDKCEEMSEADFKSDCQKKIDSKATALLYTIKYHYAEWKKALSCAVEAAKEQYKKSVYAYTYKYLCYGNHYCLRYSIWPQRDAAIKKYNEAIDEMANKACASYSDALLQRYYSIRKFHTLILERSLKCFQTRLEKIEEYKKSIRERINKYYNSFKSTMAKIVEKRSDCFQNLLFKVHCSSSWQLNNIRYVVSSYRNRLYSECFARASTYYSKMLEAEKKLIQYYKCSYRCATYSGTLCFQRKSYYDSCKTIGTWWSCSTTVKYTGFRYIDYRFTYKPCQYKKLRTCDLNNVNVSLEKFKTDMKNLGEKAVEAARSSFTAWKNLWTQRHFEIYNAYVKIVEERHRFLVYYMTACYYVKYQYLCSANKYTIAAYVKSLEERKEKAIAAYKQMLHERILQGCAIYNSRITCYKKMVDDMITKVVSGYEKCLETRKQKIAEYTSKLNAKKNELRKCLETRLSKVVDLKCDQYYQLMLFYNPMEKLCGYPFDLWLHYKIKVFSEYYHQLSVFDAHWKQLIPCLTQHYACGYKCKSTLTFGIPQMNFCLNWKFVMPTSSCYSYYYNRYCTYHTYRYYQCDGYYVYRR